MMPIASNTLIDANLVIKKAGLKEGGRVADLGCGSLAYFTFPLSEVVGESGLVYAVDILKKSLLGIDQRINNERIHNIKTVWSNIEIFKATNIESNSLDAAFLINSLHQFNERKAALRETIRLLKKGGRLIIVDWINSKKYGPNSDLLVDKDNLTIVAQKFGTSLVEEFTAGKNHFGLIFEKI